MTREASGEIGNPPAKAAASEFALNAGHRLLEC